MVVIIRDSGTGQSDTPVASKIIQTQESNLDIVEFNGTKNFSLNNLDEFEFRDLNNNVIFAGYVRENENGDINKVFGFDYGIELGEIRVRKNFQNVTPLEILEDVINNFTSLTFVNSGVTTIRTINLYPSNNKTAIEIINDMHKLLKTTHYVDINKNFTLEFEGSELNTNVLEVNVNCDITTEGWIVKTDSLVKNVTVNGDVKRIEEPQLLSGDGSQTTFTLENPYVDVKVEHPVGTLLQPEIEDYRAGDYRINKETKEIIFNVAPASGTDNILVNYVYELQVDYSIIEVTESEIVAGTNPHHDEINANFLKEVLECKDYAEKYKEKFGRGLREISLLVNDFDITKYRANQRIRVKDDFNKIDGNFIDDEFIIKRIERRFGNGATPALLVTVGDSDQLVYDAEVEIGQRIQDFNQTNPSIELFNEGIPVKNPNRLQVEFNTSGIDLKVATLPQNILVYDVNRTYINANDYDGTNGYEYIDGSDFINLFEDVE